MKINPAIYKILTSLVVVKRIFTKPAYAKLLKLLYKYGSLPRFTETIIKFDNTKFIVPDVASFLSTYEELIYHEIYTFNNNNDNPVIVDFGANIGLSVYFWQKKYPKATIHAYEADPYIYKYLVKNTQTPPPERQNLYLYNNAVHDKNTTLHFASDHADGGHIANTGTKIQAIDAAEILSKFPHIDMLKIDIEGSERVVVPRIAPYLRKVDNIFIEYHSEENRPQCLAEILTILQEASFRIHMQPVSSAEKPLIETKCNSGFDLQVNIWGKRQ